MPFSLILLLVSYVFIEIEGKAPLYYVTILKRVGLYVKGRYFPIDHKQP